jgi:transposase InsO family protein
MTKELHAQARKKFKRVHVVTHGLDDVWAMDLADMNEFKADNDNIRYILTVIDCFSRYAWAVPLKNKTGDEVLNALIKIIEKSGREPRHIWVDAGKEFVNHKMKKWLEENDIEMYHTYGEHKSAMIERFNRTLKTKMWQKLTEEQSNRWIDSLPDHIAFYLILC